MSTDKAGGGSTRLERLLLLLETGATPAVRRAAADQVAAIAAAAGGSSAAGQALLRRVTALLRSKDWETRTAAAACLGAAVEAMPHPTAGEVARLEVKGEAKADDAPAAPDPPPPSASDDDGFSLDAFDAGRVVARGAHLLASGGSEYDVAVDAGLPPAQRLARQRARLARALGLDCGGGGGGAGGGGGPPSIFDAGDLITDADLATGEAGGGGAAGPPASSAAAARDLAAEMEGGGLSARERAQRKRAARKAGGGAGGGAATGAAAPKAEATGPTVSEAEADAAAAAAVLAGGWPAAAPVATLASDLLADGWEARHGAALGLREVLRTQASRAGVVGPPRGVAGRRGLALCPPGAGRAAAASNAAALEGLALRLLLVLALDKFADYVGDAAVGPVREAAAQALGSALVAAPDGALATAASALGRLAALPAEGGGGGGHGASPPSADWQARHGGLLGLKYLLAARPSAAAAILPSALPAALAGLGDRRSDDVRLAAAEALLPGAAALSSSPADASAVSDACWEALLDLDDLSPATRGVMDLLAALVCAGGGGGGGAGAPPATASRQPLTSLLPRLWPLFAHRLPSVRAAAGRCVAALASSSSAGAEWLGDGATLTPALRLAFQGIAGGGGGDGSAAAAAARAWDALVSSAPAPALAAATTPPLLSSWVALAARPPGSPPPPGALASYPAPGGVTPAEAAKAAADLFASGGGEDEASLDAAAAARSLAAAAALGRLGAALSARGGDPSAVAAALGEAAAGHVATGRLVSGAAAVAWADDTASGGGGDRPLPPASLTSAILTSLSSPHPPYAEAGPLLARAVAAADALAAAWPPALAGAVAAAAGNGNGHAAAARPTAAASPFAALAPEALTALAAAVPPTETDPAVLTAANALVDAATAAAAANGAAGVPAAAALASAALALAGAPPRLNTVAQPLMAALRRAAAPGVRALAADGLARLVGAAGGRSPNPVPRIVGNVCALAAGDPAVTVRACDAGREDSPPPECAPAASPAAIARLGGEAALRALASRFPGPALGAACPELLSAVAAPLQALLQAAPPSAPPTTDLQPLLDALTVARTLGPARASAAPEDNGAAETAALLAPAATAPWRAVRSAASAAAAALVAAAPASALPPLLSAAAAALDPARPDPVRAGGVRLASALVGIGAEEGSGGGGAAALAAPAAALLAVPLMAAASDAHPSVRSSGAAALGAAVRLLPLAVGRPPPAWVSSDAGLAARWEADGPLLAALVDGGAAPPYTLPPGLLRAGVSLRPYQSDGIAWLAFLRRAGLHGVLADDMGLGKTLQTAAALAAVHADAKKSGAGGGASPPPPAPRRPSLVVCPATLVGHWPAEVAKHVEDGVLTVLRYEGPPAERAALRPAVEAAGAAAAGGGQTGAAGRGRAKAPATPPPDVVVMSYDTLRADAAWVAGLRWRYAVLDEGHAIRNPASRLAGAAAGIVAEHRLILSGTPIQNDVRELWALFSFLMPGLLGSAAAFTARYGRALDAAKSRGRALAAAQGALLALGGLHRTVEPFILRRTKEGVLKDLPPKTVQDVVVAPSPLQAALYAKYEGGAGAAALSALAAAGEAGGGEGGGGGGGAADGPPPPAAATAAAGAFTALAYLRKLCTSPLLVLDTDGDPAHAAAACAAVPGARGDAAKAAAALSSPASILEHAPKLGALRDLLVAAGIIVDGEDADDDGAGASGACHRVLIFAQLRASLDLVEAAVLRPASVPFLRIDGSVPGPARFPIAAAFEADPTIPVMLLTTAVGGLGLNLTAADTVIFLEHDWNPMKDLQAMDRAHRLGQARAVGVYRLLTAGTLEERVLGLQRFKLDVAAAVVNADNVSLGAMDTGRLLDSLGGGGGGGGGESGPAAAAAPGRKRGAADVAAAATAGGRGLKAALAGLEELWDEAQYDEEYDVAKFAARLQQGSGGGGGGGGGEEKRRKRG